MEIEIEPFIQIECPYCYNVRNITDINDFRTDNKWRITIVCDAPGCYKPMYVELVVPKGMERFLGMDSATIRIAEDETTLLS